MSKPSIGRMVIYTQPDWEIGVGGAREHPAVITRVIQGRVNLHVFFDTSGSRAVTNVPQKGSEQVVSGDGTWHWPERNP